MQVIARPKSVGCPATLAFSWHLPAHHPSMERSDLFHRLAAELDAQGICRIGAMPAGTASTVAARLGVSRARLKQLKALLKRADGDPELAHTMRNHARRDATKSSRAARYSSDHAYRNEVLDAAKARRTAGYAYQVFKSIRGNARTRGLAFDLTQEDVVEMLRPMTCSVTGMRLKPGWSGPGRNPGWPSNDQLDPRGGYSTANVRVVSWAYNVMRGELTDAEVMAFASALTRGQVAKDVRNGEALLDHRVGRAHAVAAYSGRWRTSAKRRGLEYDVSRDWLEGRLAGGVCEATGLALSFEPHASAYRNPLVPSLDRLDTARGYVEDNLRLVCGWFNYARQDWPDALVMEVAASVVSRRTGGSRTRTP